MFIQKKCRDKITTFSSSAVQARRVVQGNY